MEVCLGLRKEAQFGEKAGWDVCGGAAPELLTWELPGLVGDRGSRGQAVSWQAWDISEP